MHVAVVNYVYDADLESPEALLGRYEALTGWAEGLEAAGAQVSVVQRFRQDAEIGCGRLRYHFVREPARRAGSPGDPAYRLNAAVARLNPDVIHINSLVLARQAGRLKSLLPHVPLLAQDHADTIPRHPVRRWRLRRALRHVDAVSFAAMALARPWQQAGVLDPRKAVFALMEGSSHFRLLPREAARARTGLAGNPLCLWVGRLDANKDPLTVLRGFARALPRLPEARLAMVYGTDDLLPAVRAWLAENPAVAAHVDLLGRRPHSTLEVLYNSADLFLLGSHHEGSGFAVLESLACGVLPILSDIPSFRALTADGALGRLWPVEDAEALAGALVEGNGALRPDTPCQVRAGFEARWSYEAIGRSALAAYETLRSP
ncbi:MAG TPA: glycosyltransferase family 4 protein [Chthonomonadaceae bacterium]|nr:glycosyltransferase family 4 protein [Chthonomonadaceae bacterium]